MQELRWIKLDTGLLARLRPLEKKYGEDRALALLIKLMIYCAQCRKSVNLNDKTERKMLQTCLNFSKTAQLSRFCALLANLQLIDPMAYFEDNRVAVPEVMEAMEYQEKRSRAGKAGMEKRWGTNKTKLKFAE